MDATRHNESPRVLLVDDDQNVIKSLKRLISFIEPAAYIRTALGGDEGIQALREEHFDLVISDLRMPHIDGAQMLSSVRRNQPDTVRVLLSGQGTVERLLEALPVSHQYLEKPCPTDRLRNLMDVLELVKQSSIPAILLKHALAFTSFPCDPHVLNLLRLALEEKNEEVASQRIARIIPADLGLYLAMLRLRSVASGISPLLIASLASSSLVIPVTQDEHLLRQHRILTIKFHMLRKLLVEEEHSSNEDAVKVAAFAYAGELVLLLQLTQAPEYVRELEPYARSISALLARLWGAAFVVEPLLSSEVLQKYQERVNLLLPPEQADLTASDDLITMLGEVLCSTDFCHDFH